MAAEAPAARPVWRAAIVLAALVLAWQAMRVNLALYDDSGRPRLAPARDAGGESAALRGALAANPAEAGALVMIAREHEAAGDARRAEHAYRAALAIAPLEPEVLQLAAAFFLRREDPAAIPVLGRLAEGPAREAAFAALAALLPSGRHAAAIDELLAKRPAWQARFLLASCRAGIDPALLARWMASGPVSSLRPEAACAIDRLREAGRWDEAYQVWLNALPAARLKDVGHVFNGGFEHAPTETGFDWMLQGRPEREAGHAAAVLPTLGAAGTRALRVTYTGGRQNGVPVRQFLALAPGRYELEGRARHESIKALRGVHWTVRCVERARPGGPIAASERFVGSGEWRRFAFEVGVPVGCAGQLLQLEPAVEPGEPAFVSGLAWFDDLRLRRR